VDLWAAGAGAHRTLPRYPAHCRKIVSICAAGKTLFVPPGCDLNINYLVFGRTYSIRF